MSAIAAMRRRAGGMNWRMLAGGAAAVMSAGLAVAQPAGGAKKDDAAAAKSGPAPVLLFERAALSKTLVDPKDAALGRAVEMLPSRLRELPGELGNLGGGQGPIIDMAVTLVARPTRIAITYNADDPTGGAFGAGIVFSVKTNDKDEAVRMNATFSALLSMAGTRFKTRDSAAYSSMVEMPGIPVINMLRYGPRQAADGWRYELHVGAAGDPDATFDSLDTMAPPRPGFEPLMKARIDLRALAPLVENVKDMAGGDPKAEEGFAFLEALGLVGPNAMRYTFQAGHTKDQSLTVSVTEGLRPHAAAMGIGTTPLSEADLRVIPADAYVAGIRQIDVTSSIGAFNGMRETNAEVDDFLEQFKQHTGVDPVMDILGAMGGTAGYYMADSTGGSGMLSAVGFVALRDRAKFEAASGKLVGFGNTALAGPTRGYVRARQWTDGDVRLVTLTFPGVPVPLEITYATTDRFLIAALSPQAAVAATRQAMGKGDAGLGSNNALAGALPKGKGLESVGYVDVERTMARGYQYVALGGSMLANLARSPSDPGREPGLVVPTYAELRKGVRPRVSFGYWDGDNLVREKHGNTSLLVEAAGTIGVAEPFFPVITAAMSGAAIAGAKAQQEAMGRFMVPPPAEADGHDDEEARPMPDRRRSQPR